MTTLITAAKETTTMSAAFSYVTSESIIYDGTYIPLRLHKNKGKLKLNWEEKLTTTYTWNPCI